MGLGSKLKRFFISSSSEKQALNPDAGLDFKSKAAEFGASCNLTDFGGSRDEDFFDSKLWFDSDCEDDFCSVNGDFTPSQGSTPNNQMSIDKPSVLVDKCRDSESETSPTGRKKLADILQETSQGEKAGNKEMNGKKADFYAAETDKRTKSLNGTPYTSGVTSESTPSGDSNTEKAKLGRSMNCCFPRLVRSFRLNRRKKQL